MDCASLTTAEPARPRPSVYAPSSECSLALARCAVFRLELAPRALTCRRGPDKRIASVVPSATAARIHIPIRGDHEHCAASIGDPSRRTDVALGSGTLRAQVIRDRQRQESETHVEERFRSLHDGLRVSAVQTLETMPLTAPTSKSALRQG